MGLKTFTIDFQTFANRHYLYASYKFHFFNKEIQKTSNILKNKLNCYFDIFTGYAFKSKDYDDHGTKLLRIGDFNKFGDFNTAQMAYLPNDYAERYKKYGIKNEDIVIALTGATIGKTSFIYNLKETILLNQRVGLIRAKNKKVNSKFFYYLTKLNSFQFQIQIDSMGKGQQNICPKDVSKIKIPLIPKSKQDQVVAKIEPIEKKIKELKAQTKQPQEIINKVFAREFGFDRNLYNKFGKGMTAGTQIADAKELKAFEIEFKKISRSNILRFSTRYHNPPTKKLMNLLDCMDTLQVKDFITEPIHRGASPKYNPDGDVPVVKTGHLKNGYVEISQEEFVDQDFYKSSERSQVKENDILIASTGKVSLGKIDLLKIDHEIVVDGHISILRIDEKKYNRLFFTYFFRCILGYFQIERDYTGATNQIELYAKEITNFQIPEIPLEKQQKIVDEIKAELDKQEEINKQIKQKRKKIDEIIKKVIT